MAAFGELCLWAAAPLAALAAVTSIGGGWTGRGDLEVVGGRATGVTAVLLLVGLVGLGYALVTVELRYGYVAAYSGFQYGWSWRLAALWSAPAGGTLLLTFLAAAAGVLSYCTERSRQAAARTGALAALTFVGLLVVARARPFAQLGVPAVAGVGLPFAVRDPVWQLSLWATFLATAATAFAFAGVVGEQIAESPASERPEREAAVWAAALLTLALSAAAWSAAAHEDRLFGPVGLASVAVHLPAWLLALSYLHAPAGAVATWAPRWRRILGVALFPAALGATASLLAALGDLPPALPWAAGFAVGLVSGGMAGLGRPLAAGGRAEAVPGFGPFALLGGLATLTLAGLAALWGIVGGSAWRHATWPVMLLGLAGIVGWSVRRPAGRWKRVWPTALTASVLGGLIAYGLSDWRTPGFAVAGALATGVLAGFAADLMRVVAAGRRLSGDPDRPEALDRKLLRARTRRRWASATAHLGAALLVLGLAAGDLVRSETRSLVPGDRISAPGHFGARVEVTFLGLSRYQVDDQDKQVASFTLRQGDDAPQLITAAQIIDGISRRQFRQPAVRRGVLRDVIIDMMGQRGRDTVLCRLSVRPLAGLLWLGAILTLAALLLRGGHAEAESRALLAWSVAAGELTRAPDGSGKRALDPE